MGDLHQCLPSKLSPQEPQAGGQSQTDTLHLTGSLLSRRKGQAHSPCGVEGDSTPSPAQLVLVPARRGQGSGVLTAKPFRPTSAR